MTLFATAALLFLALQTPGKGTIEGAVVRVGTDTPIAGAQVTLIRVPQGPDGSGATFTAQGAGGGLTGVIASGPSAVASPAAETDPGGHFIFRDLQAGAYIVRAAADGYARQEYGLPPQGQKGLSTNVSLAAGQTINDVVLHLTPGGNVSGRITGPAGEPLAGIEVSLLRAVYEPTGRRIFSQAGAGQTNDLGEYRLFWITPGRYYLSAGLTTRPSPFAGNAVSTSAKKFATTFFPSALDSSKATLIDLKPGADMRAMDIRLAPQQMYTVRGRIIDSAGQLAPRGVSLSIALRDPPIRTGLSGSSAPYNPADGTFELRDVAPGSYWVMAQAPFAVRPSPGGPPPQPPTALAKVDVVSSDVDGVVLTIAPGLSLSGRLRADDPLLSARLNLERLTVLLGAAPAGFALVPSPRPARANADGTFTLDSVMTGDYQLTVGGLPAGVYVKEALFGAADVLSRPLSLSGAAADQLQIVLSAKAGQLSGAVTNNRQQPVAGATVLLTPEQRERRHLFKAVTTDSSGRYTIPTIPPGTYKVFAFDGIENGAFYDPEVLRQFDPAGRAVTIGDSTAAVIDLKSIPAPQ